MSISQRQSHTATQRSVAMVDVTRDYAGETTEPVRAAFDHALTPRNLAVNPQESSLFCILLSVPRVAPVAHLDLDALRVVGVSLDDADLSLVLPVQQHHLGVQREPLLQRHRPLLHEPRVRRRHAPHRHLRTTRRDEAEKCSEGGQYLDSASPSEDQGRDNSTRRDEHDPRAGLHAL
jgi:hypothetical protein